MRKESRSQRLAIAVLVALILAAIFLATELRARQPAGDASQGKRTVAGPHANNLHYVDCRKHDADYSGVTTITVNATEGISVEDEAIFVCSGEKIQWAAGPGVKTLEIYFTKGKEWPFKDKYASKLSGDDQHPTAGEEIADLPAQYRMKAYEYRIHVVTTANAKIDLDPHVISLGP